MIQFRKWIFPLLLFLYHLGFSFLGWRYINNTHGDASRYWFLNTDLSHSSWSYFLKPGTEIVKLITFPFVKYFNAPFWLGFVLFSSISGIGILLLYQMLQKISGADKYLYCLSVILLLLPNLHFWTSLIGKEALLFPFFVWFLIEIEKKRYFSFYLFASLLVIALIRPHVAFIVLLSYILSLMVTEKFTPKIKIWLGTSFFLITVFLIFLLRQLQDFSGGIPRVIQKYEAHIRYFKKTDAYVPLDEYYLPYKLFTFYFRPLPFEKSGHFYQIISIENTVLLLLSFVGIFYGIKHFKNLLKSRLVVFSILFIFLMGIMYVYAYANYGIIMRTKIMAAPFLYVVLIELLGKNISERKVSNQHE